VTVTQLLLTVSILALSSIATETGLSPVLAHLTLVHGSFNETLVRVVALIELHVPRGRKHERALV